MSEMPNPILEDEEEEQEEETKFAITTDGAADWAMRKIAQAKAEYERWCEYYRKRLEAEAAKMQTTVDRMTSMLAEYFQTVPHKETKTQENYPLPTGKLVFTKDKETIEHDDDALLAWAKENDLNDLIKTKEAIKWTEVKDRISAMEDGTFCDGVTGLEIPGITTKIVPGTFKVEIK